MRSQIKVPSDGGRSLVRARRKRAADGSEMLYASVAGDKRVGGKVARRTVLNIGRVEPEQVPYLRAAWAKRRLRLVWDRGGALRASRHASETTWPWSGAWGSQPDAGCRRRPSREGARCRPACWRGPCWRARGAHSWSRCASSRGSWGIVGDTGAPGYQRARERPDLDALPCLARHHAAGACADGGFDTHGGMPPVAADGPAADVPTTPETAGRYGDASGCGKAQATIGISGAFDAADRQMLNVTPSRGGLDERAQVSAHLETLPRVIGDIPLVLDRDYPSFPSVAGLVYRSLSL